MKDPETNGLKTIKELKLFEITISVLITMSLGLGAWTAKTVVDYGQTLSALSKQVSSDTQRIAAIEAGGSPNLRSHEAADNQRDADIHASLTLHERRMDKIDAAVNQAVAAFGSVQRDLGKIDAKLDGLAEALKQHMTTK